MVDANGQCVYIFEKERNCLRKIGRQGGNYTGQFNNPYGVTYLNENDVLIADTLNNCWLATDVTAAMLGNKNKAFSSAGKLTFLSCFFIRGL